MKTIQTCLKGHTWELESTAEVAPPACPVCGSANGRLTGLSLYATVAPATPSPPMPETVSACDDQLRSTLSRPAATTDPYATRDSDPSAESCARPAFAAVPGHEVLAELGRGGMGVVYKARQVALKRMVAIKMILSGSHAGPAQQARFRVEAEAVARLQHPNIVQIYEIGETDGRPFFSMEFVSGGNLAKQMGKRPLPTAEAARLVETLARAMQHAHQRGVIHRDLKPVNILLTEEGIPKITDFGLAKQMESDAGQTRSGDVMGTPSYMAPEQAAGNIDQVGPLADVYALGAMLYEALTGKPPFRAATSLETLHQVLHDELVPPSRLARVPADLETICLKALAKDPALRYVDALSLASDLARFQAGEPIQARREALARRTWRKIKRRPALIGSCLVALAAALLVGYFAVRDTQSAQVSAILRELDAGMEPRHWPEDRLAALENRIAELDRLDAEQAAEARQRLLRRYAEVLRESFSLQAKPILAPEDIHAFEARIDALAGRDLALADAVRLDFQKRLRSLQAQLLEPPFDNLAALLPGARVRPAKQALVVQPANAAADEVLPTALPCLGTVELEVTFDPSWQDAGRLGLVLNYQKDRSEYLFLFGVPDHFGNQGEPVPPPLTDILKHFRKKGGEVGLQIFRNGQKLREHRLDAMQVLAGASQLTLLAGRDGDRLTFQVNGLAPAIYHDAFPLAGAAPGVFALRVPPGIGIVRLRAASQASPPQPSPLERGDEFYGRGQFQEALGDYRMHELADVDSELGQVLRYKVASCLLRLNRATEAASLFEEVAAAKGQRWPPLAAFQLWIVRKQESKLDQVDTLLLDLTRRYTVDHLATLVPLEVREHLLRAYTVQSLGTKFIRHDPQRIAKLERVVALVEMLRARDYDRLHLRLSLARAYHLNAQYPQAIETVIAMMEDPALAGSWPDEPHRLLHWQIRVVEEYGWLMRLAGDPVLAIEQVDRRLFKAPGVVREPYVFLLVERARLGAFQKKWGQAESDIREFLRLLPPEEQPYRYYSEACLLLGFLRDRHGDHAGALAAWEEATYGHWFARWASPHPRDEVTNDFKLGGSTYVTNMIAGSLSGKITKADTDELVAQALAVALDDPSSAAFKDLLRVSPELLIEVWRSPRGRDAARKIAVREVPWSGFQQMSTAVVGVCMLRRGAFPGPLDTDQETLVWNLVDDLLQGYFVDGTVGKQHLFGLATTWKGNTGLFGWSSIKAGLPLPIRGPVAYVLGQRFLHQLKNPEEAKRFFQTALEDAQKQPPRPILERLARAELERLAAKK